MGTQRRLWVDNVTHRLHFNGRSFPCDRDVEAALVWQEYALLLSSDTDSLTLWDHEGLVRLAKVGMYPQDLAIQGDHCLVCGGTDGKIHRLHLPDLTATAEYTVPGMPERLCIVADHAFILTLLTEPEIHTALLSLDCTGGQHIELRTFTGIPEAISADDNGLWIAVSEGAMRLIWEEIMT